MPGRWLDRPGYIAAFAFLAGVAVAAIVAIVFFVRSEGGGDDGGSSVLATGTAPISGTPAQTSTPEGATPAATPTAAARTADDALAALIRDQFDSAYIGPCPQTPGGEIPQGLCSVELHRSAELVTFIVGPPFSEGIGEAVLTPNEDGTWSADVVPAPELGGPGLAVGVDAIVYGAGDCLNFRAQPGTGADVVTCQLDGTRARVADGPVDADGQVWWRLEGLGWGSEQYLFRVGP